jgi:hypothetical protein
MSEILSLVNFARVPFYYKEFKVPVQDLKVNHNKIVAIFHGINYNE